MGRAGVEVELGVGGALHERSGDVEFAPCIVFAHVDLQGDVVRPGRSEGGGGDAFVVEEGAKGARSGLGELLRREDAEGEPA